MQELEALETDKSVKIEHVLKEFETQATTDGSTDEASAVARDPLAEVEEGLMFFEKIMGETLYTMLLGMDDDESSRASDGVIELLESLDGDALKVRCCFGFLEALVCHVHTGVGEVG